MSGVGDFLAGLGEAARAGKAAGSRSAPTRTYYEDPTVAQTAADEAWRIWQRISQRVEGGAWFYRAREQVLAEEIPDIAKAYGRPVALRVERAVQGMDPSALAPAARAAERAGNQAAVRSYLRQRDGRIGIINRISLALIGRHFW